MLKALLYACVTAIVYAQNSTYRSGSDKFPVECQIEKGITAIECDGDANIVDSIPSGVTCLLQNGNETFMFSCNTKLDRSKRFLGSIGRSIGNFFGGLFGGGHSSYTSVCYCCQAPIPPNTPPNVVKPGQVDSVIYITKGETSAVVHWTPPSFHDTEDNGIHKIEVLPSGYTNDAHYNEGNHTVYFVGYDSKGLSAHTSITFQVKAIRCFPFVQPKNGVLRCNKPDIVEGTVCEVNCYSGYKISPLERNIECLRQGDNGQPSRMTIDCKAVRCENAPVIQHGQMKGADGHRIFTGEYGVQCEPGYYPKIASSAICNEDGQWIQIPVCYDVERPSFSECPSDIVLSIDAANNTAMVDWSVPAGTDNSGEEPSIIEENGYVPPMRFDVGLHQVKYNIRDRTGNNGSRCIFHVTITSVSCEPPLLNPGMESHMEYTCPSLYRVGSTCELSCKHGYPRAGADTIQCDFDLNGNPNWKWDGFKPFCRETNCTVLSPPENGSLSCSEWTQGQTCQMQCQKGWDIPFQSFGVFTCTKSDGIWRPQPSPGQALIPDCSRMIRNERMRLNLPSECFYYTGACNSTTENLIEIQNNFIQALNTSAFRTLCLDDTNCDARFVQVTCGPVSGRQKRDSEPISRAASKDFAYKVEFVLNTQFKPKDGQTDAIRYQELEAMMYDIVDKIADEIDNGLFSIQGLTLDSKSLSVGNMEFDCPKGTQSKPNTPKCVGCSSGLFMDGSGTCQLCPRGSYQNESNSFECIPCPNHTNTTSEGSTKLGDCKERCEPGTYSFTGLQPCAKCSVSRYQSDYYGKNCTSCPSGLRTFQEGADSILKCGAYDFKITKESYLRKATDKAAFEASLIYWVYTKIGVTSTISNADHSFHILVNTSAYIHVSVSGDEVISTVNNYAMHSWALVALVLNNTHIRLYHDGKLCLTKAIKSSRRNSIEIDDLITFTGVGLISSPYLLSGLLTADTISKIKDSRTCLLNFTSFLHDPDFFSKGANNAMLISSKCDSLNECASNPCGTNHTCLDQLADFECICSQGYSGKNCEVAPDHCALNECQNEATCTNSPGKYTCQCPHGFSGAFCNIRAVDGQWSPWGAWSECSKTCGGGLRSHHRRCSNPPPDAEGSLCNGLDTEPETCATKDCPKCRRLLQNMGSSLICNKTDDGHQTCIIECKPGYFFATQPLESYECGPGTNYLWTHETVENPHAILPKCEEASTPVGISLRIAIPTEIPCSDKNVVTVKETMNERLRATQCVVNGSCTQSVLIACEQSPRKRRAIESIGMTIELQGQLSFSGVGLNFEELLNGQGPSLALTKLLLTVASIENTTQKLYNESESMIALTIDGTTYRTDRTSFVATPLIKCPSGKVPNQFVCVTVPVGAFSNGAEAVLCKKGTYQELPGQTACTPCPAGTTTEGIGSENTLDCITEQITEEQHIVSGVSGGADVAVIVGSLTAVIVLFSTLVIGFIVYKFKNMQRLQRVGQSDASLQPYELHNLPMKA